MIRALAAVPCEEIEIRARDGVRLAARYYHVADGAPLEIEFHGYRGSAVRDFSAGNALARSQGRNVLLVDQRAHGRSGGWTISLGVRELIRLSGLGGGSRPAVWAGRSDSADRRVDGRGDGADGVRIGLAGQRRGHRGGLSVLLAGGDCAQALPRIPASGGGDAAAGSGWARGCSGGSGSTERRRWRRCGGRACRFC